MKQHKLLVTLLTTAALGGYLGTLSATPAPVDDTWVCTPVVAPAQTVNTPTDAPTLTAKAGFLIEARSGTVLLEHNADQRLPIASMTKIATLGVIYDALAHDQIKWDDPVLVSDLAASMGGSQAFLDAGSTYPVHELVQSIVVASANDSCVALAEKVAGSVTNFVEKMNQFAKNVGCTNTNFVNCTGLPTPGAFSSARDLSKMYAALMQYPHYADFNHVWLYDLTHPTGRVTGLTNTNKLIRTYDGCLGGKTGFTNEAGHCITVAAERGAVRPIAVIIGAPDSKTRFQESAALLDYACQSFENRLVVDHTQPLQDVTVKNAVVEWTTLYPATDFYCLMPKGHTNDVTIATEINDTITAPIKGTDACGKIMVLKAGKVIAEIPVVTGTDLPAATYLDNLKKLARNSQLH